MRRFVATVGLGRPEPRGGRWTCRFHLRGDDVSRETLPRSSQRNTPPLSPTQPGPTYSASARGERAEKPDACGRLVRAGAERPYGSAAAKGLCWRARLCSCWALRRSPACASEALREDERYASTSRRPDGRVAVSVGADFQHCRARGTGHAQRGSCARDAGREEAQWDALSIHAGKRL